MRARRADWSAIDLGEPQDRFFSSATPHRPTRFSGAVAPRPSRRCSPLCATLAPNALESAAANGDTRTLFLYHSHSKESLAATFRVNGHYDAATLEKLNWFLRDWRNDEPTQMDPKLFDVLWEAYRSADRMGPEDPIVVVSAYRCPATNAMLRQPLARGGQDIRSTCWARRWTRPCPACPWRGFVKSACACSAAASAIIPMPAPPSCISTSAACATGRA